MYRRTTAITFALLLVACNEAQTPSNADRPAASSSATTARFALDMGGDAGPNTPPVAADDQVSVDEDDTATIEVLANDSDDDGDELTVFISQNAAEGALTEADGIFTYAPRANFNGSDSFTYGLLDGRGGSDEATVTITVQPVNDPPSFASPTPPNFGTIGAVAGMMVEFQMAGSDIDDDTLTFGFDPFDVAGDPPTVTDRTFQWTPSAADVGLHDVTIFVTDGIERDERDVTLEVAESMDVGGDCTDDTDCPDGNRCFDGSCAADACDGVTCPDGESCFGGGCFAPCETVADCANASGCFNGRCAASACAEVTCAASARCLAGACGDICTSADQCGDGEECFAGTCQPEGRDLCEGISCGAESFCSLGDCTVCEGGSCGDEPKFGNEGCGCSQTSTTSGGVVLALLVAFVLGAGRRLRRH